MLQAQGPYHKMTDYIYIGSEMKNLVPNLDLSNVKKHAEQIGNIITWYLHKTILLLYSFHFIWNASSGIPSKSSQLPVMKK